MLAEDHAALLNKDQREVLKEREAHEEALSLVEEIIDEEKDFTRAILRSAEAVFDELLVRAITTACW